MITNPSQLMKLKAIPFTLLLPVLLTTPATAASLAVVGVDFENAAGTAWDRTPDDLIAGDGITVSDWQFNQADIQGSGSKGVINDGNADDAFEGTFVGRMEALSSPGDTAGQTISFPLYFTVTIDSSTIINFDSINFAYRGATGGTSTRQLLISASVGGGAPINLFTASDNSNPLPGRTLANNWVGAPTPSALMSDAAFQNLTNTTVRFNFWTTGGIDIDAIEINASIVPEPSTALLGGIGLLALLRRRR